MNGAVQPEITAVVVIYESGAVIDECLDALERSAPRRGVAIRVVDNASSDDGADRAARRLGPDAVVRRASNGGFGAGVNAALGSVNTRWIALVNPDLELSAGALDELADVLESDPKAALVGPRLIDLQGRPEPSAGWFPNAGREWSHAIFLDRWTRARGRRRVPPPGTGDVEWVSGACWLVRREALDRVGLLDEGYFMFFEDVDWCYRAHAAGWRVLATDRITVRHGFGRGSARSSVLPADGGEGPLRRFVERFGRPGEWPRVRTALRTGWRIRAALYRAGFGGPVARVRAERFEAALRGATIDTVSNATLGSLE